MNTKGANLLPAARSFGHGSRGVQRLPDDARMGRAGERVGPSGAVVLVPPRASPHRDPVRARPGRDRGVAGASDAPLPQAELRPSHGHDRRPRCCGAGNGGTPHPVLRPDPLRAGRRAKGPQGAARRAALRSSRVAPARHRRCPRRRSRRVRDRLGGCAAGAGVGGTIRPRRLYRPLAAFPSRPRTSSPCASRPSPRWPPSR